MNLIYISPDPPRDWDLYLYRCLGPAQAVDRSPRHTAALISLKDFITPTEPARDLCSQADVLIIQHDLVGAVLPAVQHWKAREKTVLVDIQMSQEEMQPSAPGYPSWLQSLRQNGALDSGQPHPALDTQFAWGLKLVDGAVTPTPRLEYQWKKHISLHHHPSCLDLDHYRKVSKPARRDGLRIGWILPDARPAEFERLPVFQALRALLENSPHLTLVFGNLPEKVLAELPLPDAQKDSFPRRDGSRWAKQIAGLDLGILPLSQARYDHHRYIRALEYMTLQVPWIYSLPRPSGFPPAQGWMISNHEEEWLSALTTAVLQLEAGLLKGTSSGYLYSLSQHIGDQRDGLIDLYRSFQS